MKEEFLVRIHKVYFLTAQISSSPVLVLFVKVKLGNKVYNPTVKCISAHRLRA
jgi:hypothetical protein